MNVINQYQTENSVFLRIKLTKDNLKKVLENLPVDIDRFLYDDLLDEPGKLEDIFGRYLDETKVENYVGKNAEVYLIFQEKTFDLIFISLGGKVLLQKVIGELNNVLMPSE